MVAGRAPSSPIGRSTCPVLIRPDEASLALPAGHRDRFSAGGGDPGNRGRAFASSTRSETAATSTGPIALPADLSRRSTIRPLAGWVFGIAWVAIKGPGRRRFHPLEARLRRPGSWL